ncbi:MAG: hypothetical protein GKR94_32830 [Gammaproteobacteria bacterium]|nr:hypothetical protein [Gammaproteobacteria bacterium]
MSLEIEIYLNQLAQGIKSVNKAVEWFVDLADNFQLDVLTKLAFFILQAGGLGRDVEEAIFLSGLRKTYTPCQLLLKAQRDEPEGNILLKQVLTKAINLPENERQKSFRLLLALFSIADKRKRSRGLDPDKYWWHRDLSDDVIVDEILSEN